MMNIIHKIYYKKEAFSLEALTTIVINYIQFGCLAGELPKLPGASGCLLKFILKFPRATTRSQLYLKFTLFSDSGSTNEKRKFPSK